MPFDPGGWESAGWPVWNSMRWRLWVPPGARVGPRWGILIRDNVSPKGSIAILNAIPMMDLDQHGHVVLPARRSRGA
jgi:hypothetical protein